jgi:tetratricopeptide (TPR) repeat protein
MTRLVRLFRGALAVLLCAGLSGCLPSGRSQSEEENEPHYLQGKNCISSMDYKGAIEEFEKALEVNPHSAAAHFQLGWLYEEKAPDPAMAIYHWEQFLKLRPDYGNAEIIRQHITNCKQDLAKSVLPLPIAPGLEHRFEQLADENNRLRQELEKWRVYASQLQAGTNRPAPPPEPAQAAPIASAAQPPAAGLAPTAAAPARPTADSGAARAYVVRTGDTPYSIARKNGVKLDALLAANPGLDPRRLRVGQSLNLPAP